MAGSASNSKNWYTELASLPIYTSAHFLSDKVVRVDSAIRDHVRNTKRSSSKTLFVQSSPDVQVFPSASQDISADVLGSTISASGKLTAILREAANPSGGDKKRFVEIWANERLEASVDVSKLHGTFYTEDQLSSLSFSPSETALVYTAEANAPEDDSDPFAKYRFVPDFGEGYIGKKQPSLFVAKWQAPSSPSSSADTVVRPLAVLETPTKVLLGQAVFATEDTIVATGYEYSSDGRLLGIKGCWNRPTAVWLLAIEPLSPASASDTPISVSSASKISDPAHAARSPRVYHDASSYQVTVFYLAHELGGPHATCSALHAYDLQAKQDRVVVPMIDKVRADLLDGFAGLYDGLIVRPFVRLSGKLHVISQTSEGPTTTIVLIDAEQPSVINHLTRTVDSALPAFWSWTLLATDGEGLILAARSSPTVPYELVLGRLQEESGRPSVQWHVVEKPTIPAYVEEALRSLKTSVVQIPNRYPVETIVIEPTSSTPQPLLSFIHGGPHGNCTTAFSPLVTALALQGYTLSLPNYTGSVGYGDHYVQKLIGQCGTLDVEDVKASVDTLVQLGKAEFGPGKQLIIGGSHGGFLGAHLIGQYPDIFTAAVLRNPVISSQPASTDIPDWYFWEFGITPSLETEQMTPELYAKLYLTSPIAHVGKVKAAVLLMLGLDDQRVVNVQGKTFYHALKTQGKEVDMLVFKGEGHPLEGVEASRIGWEAAVAWYDKARSQGNI